MSDTSQLFRADAGELFEQLAGTAFDLIYLDPPYSVGTVMSTRDERGQARGRKGPRSGRDAYTDPGDVDALVAMLESVLSLARERMSEQGSLWLHMDHRAIHDAKVAADRVFGRNAFAGEVVWTPGNGSRGARGFSVTHQTIVIYNKSPKRRLRYRCDHPLLREPYAPTSLQMHFTNKDEHGRRYRERRINGKSYRYYADEGRRLGSVWTDAPAMVANTPLRMEATGYPTQKPERLLERILRAATDPGDTVADPMCGSGTTLVVAARLGRRFVGADVSDVAIEMTRARLDAARASYRFDRLSSQASRSASCIPRQDARPDPARS